MVEKSSLINLTIARDLIPVFLTALDMAVTELRKQYRNPDLPVEFAENVGRLQSFREIIASQFEAEKAA